MASAPSRHGRFGFNLSAQCLGAVRAIARHYGAKLREYRCDGGFDERVAAVVGYPPAWAQEDVVSVTAVGRVPAASAYFLDLCRMLVAVSAECFRHLAFVLYGC
jgi:hypothetical protein